jgi:hypothetical protein
MDTAVADPRLALVKLAIPDVLLLEHLLRLPEGTRLAGASVDYVTDGATSLVLHLEMPGVPDGADEMVPAYERDTALPDPVRLAGIEWKRRGHPLPAGPDDAR